MTAQDGNSVAYVLAQAARYVERFCRDGDDSDGSDIVHDPETAHATVASAYRLASAMADLVNVVMEQLPAAVPGDAGSAAATREVIADLRAMHGCMTTGVLLLDPALQDLRGLAAPADGAGARTDAAVTVAEPVPE